MYDEILSTISTIIGWAYMFAWSISFYPQAILNWKRQSVQGLSIDFLWYNFYGFLCYSVFSLAFLFSEEIRQEYRDRNNGKESLVRVNDVFFSLHALFLCAITLVQSFIYRRDPNQKISPITSTLIRISLVITIFFLIGIRSSKIQWIDLLYYLSFIKISISCIKYIPQAFLNFQRKSTVGWSIHNILLDFTGGILSICQLILDAYLTDNWAGIKGHPVKFGIGLLSITFDLLFMTQHYLLYRNREDYYDPIMHDNDDGNDDDSNNLSLMKYLLDLIRNENNNSERERLLKNDDDDDDDPTAKYV